MRKISVLLADGDEALRAALSQHLAEDGLFSVVGSVGDGPALMAAAEKLQPDLIVMDIVLPGIDGFAALSALAAVGAPRVVVLSSRAQEDVQYRAWRCGAQRFLSKPCELDRLALHLRAAAAYPPAARETVPAGEELLLLHTLREIGISPRYLELTMRMLLICLRDPGALRALEKKVYRACLPESGGSTDAVSHRLSYAIADAWTRGDAAAQARIFGDALRYRGARPSNGEFLAGILAYCRAEEKKQAFL